MIYAAVDTETTGLNTSVDEIIEIAVILFEKTGKILEEYHSYCSPHAPIPPAATAVNKITMQMVIGHDSYEDQRNKIIEFIKKSGTIIGHNIIAFDLPIMKFKTTEDRVYDTLLVCKGKYPNRKHSLKNMCKAHKISWDDKKAHGARYDAMKAMELFLALEFGSNLQVSMFDEEEKKKQPRPISAVLSSIKKPGQIPSKIVVEHGENKVMSSDGDSLPYIKNGDLIIPFASPAKYHWWSKGQPVITTLKELGASEELIKAYCGGHISKEINVGTP